MANVGIVTTWFDRGAAYVSKAYLETLKRIHDVFIYARGGEKYGQGDPYWDHEYVTWGNRIKSGIPGLIIWSDFRNWVFSNNLEIVIFNEQQSWDVILRSLKLNIIIGSYVDYYTADTVPFFQLFDFLLCNTERHYSLFKDHPQAIYIPWGTNCDVYNGDCNLVSNGRVTFFHSCGVSPDRKGTYQLIEAFKNVQGDCELIIHSQVPINNSDVNKIIDTDNRIKVIHKTVGPPGLYHLGDVYVYPTRLEGIGLTIAEALASGLPVITPENGPMNEFVEHEVNGLLVPVERYQRRSDNYYWEECFCSTLNLTEAMQYYVDNKFQLEKFKSQAREYAEKHLDWKKNSTSLPEELESLTKLPNQPEIIRACTSYEYRRYPRLIASAFWRKIKR